MTLKIQADLLQARDALTGLHWHGYKPQRVRKLQERVAQAAYNLRHYGPTDLHCEAAADTVAVVSAFVDRSLPAALPWQPAGLTVPDVLL